MKHFYQNIGEDWFTYPNLYTEMVKLFPADSHFVEVGTWKGRSAVYMAVEIINSNKNIKFDCVDTWEYIPSQNEINQEMCVNLYETFIHNIEPVKHVIMPVKALSVDAAKYYDDESLDFVFIDAAHDYENVRKDITAWLPKVKKGGIIAGHDYNHPDVKKAVEEIIKSPTYEQELCWVYRNDKKQ